MKALRNPSEERVLAYAAGNLSPPEAVVVAAHLALRPANDAWVRQLQAVGGEFLSDAAPTPMADDALARAMAHSEYELQALIYTIALHRWLRFRLGASYDYARDFGGVRYLFCRGLDPADPAAGMYAHQPARALVDAVDALFGGGAA